MTVSRLCLLSGTVLLLGVSMVTSAQEATAPVRPLVDPTHLRLQPEQAVTGAQTVNVYGDPAKPGMYVIRRHFKPGEMTRPHYHDEDRLVTVIKGTWWTDEGDVFAPNEAIPIKTGGFMLHPKGLRHYDGSKNDEEVIVQIIGMGPVRTIPAERK